MADDDLRFYMYQYFPVIGATVVGIVMGFSKIMGTDLQELEDILTTIDSRIYGAIVVLIALICYYLSMIDVAEEDQESKLVPQRFSHQGHVPSSAMTQHVDRNELGQIDRSKPGGDDSERTEQPSTPFETAVKNQKLEEQISPSQDSNARRSSTHKSPPTPDISKLIKSVSTPVGALQHSPADKIVDLGPVSPEKSPHFLQKHKSIQRGTSLMASMDGSADVTKVYYPHLHQSAWVFSSQGCYAQERLNECTISRRNWERKEVESHEDIPIDFTIFSFIIEMLPVPIALIICWYFYGIHFTRSRKLYPYNPISDIPSMMWICYFLLVYYPVGDRVTHVFELLIAFSIIIVRAIIITFKYITFGDTDLFSKKFGSSAPWYNTAKRNEATLILNFVVDLAGTQRQVLIEHMYTGTIENQLSPQLVKFKLNPIDARRIWRFVKWHGDQMSPAGKIDRTIPGKWGRHTNHKWALFGLDLFSELVGMTDCRVEAMCDNGELPASVLLMYVVFTSYKRHCWKCLKMYLKVIITLAVATALLPSFCRYLRSEPIFGQTYPETIFNFLIMQTSLLSFFFMGSLCWAPMAEMHSRVLIAKQLTGLISGGIQIEDIDPSVIDNSSCVCSVCRAKPSSTDPEHAERPALLLNMATPENVASWDILRRLVHGPNFAAAVYQRSQFYMLASFSLECCISIFLNFYNDSKYNKSHWDLEDHPELLIPVFMRTTLITMCLVFQIIAANNVNNEAENQAMALLRAKTCWMQASEKKAHDVRKAVALIETVHKSVEVDVLGNPVCVMYLEGNYGTIGAIFTVLGTAFYADMERIMGLMLDFLFEDSGCSPLADKDSP